MDIKRQNFISADGKSAKDSYDNYFTVGDEVKHDGAVELATIIGFSIDKETNEVAATTTKGIARIDFLTKIRHGWTT